MCNINDLSVWYPKEITVNQNDDNIPPPNLRVAKLHPRKGSCNPLFYVALEYKNRPVTITCNKAGTVEDSLKKSAQFRETAEKHKDKELVIVRDRRAICSHFPCTMIRNEECLAVKYVKAADEPKKRIAVAVKASCDLLMFHVCVKGGKNLVKILRNPALKSIMHEITVYASKGERVKQALRRDGRFLSAILKKNCALSNTDTDSVTELSSLVDDLRGKTFQIILLNKSSPPASQFGSLDDAYMALSGSQSWAEPEDGGTWNKKPDLNGNLEPENLVQEMPCSKTMQDRLSSQFTECVKGLKTQAPKLSRIQNLLRAEFGQNDQMCRDVKTMRALMDLSNSVCQVRINGRPCGSGFLLLGRCVLTNGHVIRDIFNENSWQLNGRVAVHFSYESVEQKEEGRDVEEVVCYEYIPEVSGRDWALLRLCTDDALPVGLVKHLAFLPQHGGICIIGHPNGGVKKNDPCLIVPSQNRLQVVGRHNNENQGCVHLVTSSFFERVATSVHQTSDLTYESCFYFGSSGSPVFDRDCNVVAVHSGGYAYCSAAGENRSVIELGQPLLDIFERIIIQLVDRERLDVLQEYLACPCPLHQNVVEDVKNVLESRHLALLQKAVTHSVDTGDASLKLFSEFLCQIEEPVPMDFN
ncbi:serine protease FAM111A-like [Odontesthes bonariensis]|uniref:serine protease FAM111A-like n=1 Tax=Odontesthes bonariensis TaxID=219752 RepID=UPI003F582E30